MPEKSILGPMKIGVKKPNVHEAAVRTTRQWFHRYRDDPSRVAVEVDISNAFN